MHHTRSLTLGVLANWQLYDGTVAHRFLHAVFQGAYAAACERSHHMLLSCGVGPGVRPYVHAPVWPVSTSNSVFAPVGPWNCDGLVVVPPITNERRTAYVQQLRASGFPIVFAGTGQVGPAVVTDNAGGIAQIVAHLHAHGHRHIAFVAGYPEHDGDSTEREAAFRAACQRPCDQRLIAYGRHNFEDGFAAAQTLLARNVLFTAVVASNDESAFGVMAALRQANRRIPEDVAVIGFDDILDARIQSPPLTTVHYAPFELGYRAVLALDDLIAGRWDGTKPIPISTRLVVRRSCGSVRATAPDQQYTAATIVETMAQAAQTETRRLQPETLRDLCRQLFAAFLLSLEAADGDAFAQAIITVLRQSEALGEETSIWQEALSVLRQGIGTLVPQQETSKLLLAGELIDQARVTISERIRRQNTRALVQQMDVADRIGAMTAQLLAAFDEAHIAATLAAHLANVGIRHLLVACYEPDEDDPVAWSRIVVCCGMANNGSARFRTRSFPPTGLYQAEQAVQLAVLPLIVEEETIGFAAFDAANIEPCAAIMRNLGAALRTSRLYRDAREGRKLAEEANQLKSRFLSMISHELRTPLNLIAGLSDMLLRDNTTAPDQRADLERIVGSAQHLDRLIGDVLDLASSDIGQLRLNRMPINLGAELQLVVKTGERLANERGLGWHANVSAAGPHVFGDPTRVRQVVLNLLSNAAKFTTAGTLQLTVGTDNGMALIRVSDTGLGIAPQEQAYVFDEFRRGDRSAALGYRGLGLGLAISKQLVALHDGTIEVASTGVPGEGSTFTLRLPLLPQPETPPTPATFDAGQSVVLFAGNEASGQRVREQLLQRGVDVHVLANNLPDAGLLQQLMPPPQAILLDQAYASRHGWALQQVLHSDATTAHVPLLIFAADQQHNAGALLEWQHALKPLDPSHLDLLLERTNANTETNRAHTVLVVDDDAGLRDLHTRMIGSHAPAYRVLAASNGREALEYIRNEQPDLVLLDLLMPELDGFGVLEAMRADPQLQAIPVVVLTAQRLTDDDMARLSRGVSAVLTKGVFSFDETIAHIAAAIERQRQNTTTQRLVHKALSFIHTHYAEPLSREQIARHVGLNENYLTDCFHREMGITPINYLTRYRIQCACQLLSETEHSITDIALAVGFSDSAYFSRMFQRTIGVSPRAYRRGKQNLA